MRVLPINAVFGAPPYVRGLCVIRGVVVPVVDSGLLLSGHASEPERLVTITAGSRPIALAVEGVLGVRRFAPEKLAQLPPLLRVAETAAIISIGSLDEELMFCLSAARIVPDDLFDQLDAADPSP